MARNIDSFHAKYPPRDGKRKVESCLWKRHVRPRYESFKKSLAQLISARDGRLSQMKGSITEKMATAMKESPDQLKIEL